MDLIHNNILVTCLLRITYSAASACWTQTCCLAVWIGGTWCSHHCGILSSPLLWLCVVSETHKNIKQLGEDWDRTKTTAAISTLQSRWCFVTTEQHIINVWLATYIDFHFPVKSIVQKQVVSHPDTMWFHGMSLSVVIISYVTCKWTHRLKPAFKCNSMCLNYIV